MSQNRVALTLSILISLLFCSFLIHTFKSRFNYDNLNPSEKKLVLFSENAFYYSFYQDIATSPNLKTATQAITSSNRVEYPQTISPLTRFNILQETLLGFLYRTLYLLIPQLDPLTFYLLSVFALNSTLAGILFWVSYKMTSSLSISLISPLLLAITVPYSTRIVFAPSLRENFALPFLVLLVYVLGTYSQHPTRKKLVAILALAATNLLFWQFSLFTLVPIFFVFLVLNHRSLTKKNFIYAIPFIAIIFLLAGRSGFSHVTNFALQKLSLIPPTFESLMYACEEAFNSINSHALLTLSRKLILPLPVISIGLLLVQILWGSKKPSEQFLNLFFHLVTIVFLVYSFNSYRFLSLYIPFAAVSASYIFTQPKGQLRFLAILIVTAYLLFGLQTPLPKGSPSFTNELSLVAWINANTNPDDVITGTMSTTSTVKLMTGRIITNHPQFENIYNRVSTQKIYLSYTRSPQNLIHSNLTSLGTNYLILDNSNCYYRTSMGCTQQDLYQNQGYDFSQDSSFCALNTYNPSLFQKVYENPEFKVLKLIK